MSKKAPVLKINQPAAYQGSGGLTEQAVSTAPPALGSIPAPYGLVTTSVVSIRSINAQVYINIEWARPDNATPEGYIIEYGKQADFSDATRLQALVTNAALLADAAQHYYIRVAAYYKQVVSDWTSTLEINTPVDVSISVQISGLTSIRYGADVELQWTKPVDPVFRDVQITIWNSDKSILYGTYYSSGNNFIFTEADNLRVSSNAGINSLTFDVTARAWSGLLTSPALTTTATIPLPNAASSVTTEFSTGDLYINWSINNATGSYKDIIVSIYDTSAKTTKYRDIHTTGSTTSWLVADNFADSKAVGHTLPDPSVYIEIQIIGYLNKVSSIVNTTATKALPATPSAITHTWLSDTGLADEDIKFSWGSVPYVDHYEILINGKAYSTTLLELLYTFNINGSDNTNPDASLTYQVRAVDRLLQSGTLSTLATAVNVAPPTSAFSIASVTAAWDVIGIFISNSAVIQDFSEYRVVVKNSANAVVKDVRSTSGVVSVTVSSSDTYSVTVSAIDLFNQESGTKVQNNVVVSYLSLAEIRADGTYSSSNGDNNADIIGLRDDDNTQTAITITSTTEDAFDGWVQFRRPLTERFGTITFVAKPIANGSYFYFRTSRDKITWRLWTVDTAISSRTITENQAVTLREATDATDAENSSAIMDVSNLVNNTYFINRFDFPEVVEAQYVEVRVNTLANPFLIAEYYPRRTLITDDLKAESVQTINLAAGAVTAGKISVAQLSAVTTSTGTLDVFNGGYIRAGQTAYNTGTGFFLGWSAGVPKLSIGNSAGNHLRWDGTNLNIVGSLFTQGTITGTTIQTSVSNPKVRLDASGMATYDSSGNVQVLATTATNGALTAGGGTVKLDSAGIYITSPNASSPPIQNQLRWVTAGGATTFSLYSRDFNGAYGTFLRTPASTTAGSLWLTAAGTAGDTSYDATIKMNGRDGTNLSRVNITAYDIWLNPTNPLSVLGNIALGVTTGNGDAIVTTQNTGNNNNAYLSLNGGYNGYIFDTSQSSQGAQVVLHANGGIFGYGNLDLKAGKGGANGNINFSTNDLLRGSISKAGVPSINQAWQITSDSRVKDSIEDIDSHIDKIKKLQPKRYKRKYDTRNTWEYGLIAQDVQVLFPDMVNEVSLDGENILAIRYNDFIPMLLKIAQLHEDRLDKIEAKK